MTNLQLEIFRASVLLYKERVKPHMSAEYRALLRFQCTDEARALLLHVRDLSELDDEVQTIIQSAKQMKDQEFVRAVRENNGNIRKSARQLGVHVNTLRNHMKRHHPEMLVRQYRPHNAVVSSSSTSGVLGQDIADLQKEEVKLLANLSI